MTITKDDVALLLPVVERLSSPSESQTAWLEQLGTAPSSDELAMEFDDVYQVTRLRMEGRAGELADELNGLLDAMSGEENEHLWTVEALASEAEWERVRESAAELLRELTFVARKLGRDLLAGDDSS